MPKRDSKARLPESDRDNHILETDEVKSLRKVITVFHKQLLKSSAAAAKGDSKEPLAAAEVERITKAISSCLKTIEDLKRDAGQRAKDIKESMYTPYADYPPPSPEDRDRFIARIQSLYLAIDHPRRAGREAVKTDDGTLDAMPPHLGDDGKGGSV